MIQCAPCPVKDTGSITKKCNERKDLEKMSADEKDAMFKAGQKREEQPSVMQSVFDLKTEDANSPNIIASGNVTVSFGTASV